MKRLLSLAGCLLLLASACGGADADAPRTLTVRVDAAPRTGIGPFANPTFRGSFLAYFPDSVAARPGEVVRFERIETGEPHSVTLGRRVDKAFADAAKKDKDPSLPEVELTGIEDIPQNLAQPCFLDKGAPPKDPDERCDQPEDGPPAFTGKQNWYSSGFIPEEEPFELVLAEDVEPGTYRFYCLFHGPQMSGTLEVVAPGEDASTQGELDERASQVLDPWAAEGKELVEQELARYERKSADEFPYPILAGMTLADGLVRVNEFIPFTARARVDQTVSWQFTGTHIISFDPVQNAEAPGVEKLLAGTVEIKEDAVAVRRSPSLPEEPVTEPVTLTAEPYDEGTHSSGVLYSPTGLITYEISFTEPGTYRYQCLMHPGMSGIVTVTL